MHTMDEIVKQAATVTQPATKEFPIYFPGLQPGALRVPNKMSAQDFELLKTQLDNAMRVVQVLMEAEAGSMNEGRGE